MTQVPVSSLKFSAEAAVEEQALAGVAGVDEPGGVAACGRSRPSSKAAAVVSGSRW